MVAPSRKRAMATVNVNEELMSETSVGAKDDGDDAENGVLQPHETEPFLCSGKSSRKHYHGAIALYVYVVEMIICFLNITKLLASNEEERNMTNHDPKLSSSFASFKEDVYAPTTVTTQPHRTGCKERCGSCLKVSCRLLDCLDYMYY